MPRIRTLKPEHRQHRKVGPLPDREYRLWVSMILEAEDAGRLVCDAAQLRAVTWPYHPRVTIAHVEGAIQRLAETGLLRLYEHEGVRYADFPSWADHQRIDHPAKAKLPEYQHSPNPRESSRILANDPVGKERNGKDHEGKGVEDDAPVTPAPLATPRAGFSIPSKILHALERAPRLGAVASLHAPAFWQAELRANPGVELDRELLKAEAYLVAHPEKHYRKLGNFLHGWLSRADRPPEERRP